MAFSLSEHIQRISTERVREKMSFDLILGPILIVTLAFFSK